MSSIAQEHFLPQVEQAIKHVLCQAAEQFARPTGFIKRQGKVTGPSFAQTLVLGWLTDPKASLETLAQQAADVGLDIPAQGLDERFTPAAATFLQALFEGALGQVVLADPVAIPLLSRFAAVCLEESSTIRLPEELAGFFRGYGGKGSTAACKLFVRLDMLRGQLTCSPLQNATHADTRSPLKVVATPARTLHIRDRGFTDAKQWRTETEQEQFVLSSAKSDLHLWNEENEPLDLALLLPQAQASGEWNVLVADKQRLPMRLFFERVPEAVAQERRRRLKREAAKEGKSLSPRAGLLAGWTLALTTVPPAWLNREEALVLLRLRCKLNSFSNSGKSRVC